MVERHDEREKSKKKSKRIGNKSNEQMPKRKAKEKKL